MKRSGLQYSIFTPVSPVLLPELRRTTSPEDTMALMKSGVMTQVDWNATDFLSPLYVELQRSDLSQLLIVTGFLNVCGDGYYAFRMRDDLPPGARAFRVGASPLDEQHVPRVRRPRAGLRLLERLPAARVPAGAARADHRLRRLRVPLPAR